METVILLIQLPFVLAAAFLAVYLMLITIAPLFSRRGKTRVSSSKKRFAIVIPAHNEEMVIADTLKSAKRIDYPENLFDVFVVADNCTDRTASIALQHGALVFERFDDKHKGKGYALNWIIPQIIERFSHYEACVFVDADSLLSKNFLNEMNHDLHEGHRVIQSSDLVLLNSTAWRVQLMHIAFALQNFVRPLGKSLLGFPVALKGNGMCFSLPILHSLRWDVASLGEDLDMGLDLTLQGIRIHFNPNAEVHAKMPTQSSSAATQRLRWEGGRFASMRTRVPHILKIAIQKRSFYIFEAALDAAFPPLGLFVMTATLFLIMNLILIPVGLANSYMIWFWTSVNLALGLHCMLGLIIARVHPRTLLAFLYVPKFLLWKVGIYFRMIRGKEGTEWVRTARD